MKRCKYCGAFFIPDPKVGKRQKTCGSISCKKALKAKNSVKWRQKNPDYYKGDYPRVKKWFSKHPGYLRQYRKNHPEYVEKNRIAQKNRDRRKRLNLDIQAQIPLKLLESTFLFSTLPCLDIQAQMDNSCRIRQNRSI